MHRALHLVLLLSLLALAVPQCSQSSASDLLQSGSTTFVNSYAGAAVREHVFQIALNFQVSAASLQIAASTSSFFNSLNVLDYSVRGRPANQGYANLVLLVGEDNSWTTIKVTYFISGRSDFILGLFYADTYLQNRANTAVSVAYAIPYWANSQLAYTALVQLSGVKSAAAPFLFSYSNVAVSNNGLITVSFTLNGNKPTEGLFITYIVFQQNTPLAYSPFNPQNLPSSGYAFVGVESVSNSVAFYAGAVFTSSASIACVGGRCPSSCVSQQLCSTSGGQSVNNVCYLCLAGQTVANGACSSSSQIVNCPNNQVWDGSQCICASGYILVGGACYQSCGANAYIYNSACVCVPGYTYSSVSNQCVTGSGCDSNFVLVNGVCVCPSGYTQVGTQCIAGNNCVGGQYWNGVQCVCPAGQYFFNNACQSCPANSQWTGSACICISGYQLVGGQCVPNCPGNSSWTGSACTCNSGYQQVNGQCIPNCPANSSWNGASCVCNSGYQSSNGQCVPNCPANSNWNGASCVCNSGYQQVGSQCVINCPANSNWNGASCVCNSGYQQVNGQCVLNCPANSAWNGASCVCNNGYQQQNGQCVPNCPANSNWNGVSCVCNSGYQITNGQCVLPSCPANSNWNGASCVCNSGYQQLNGQCVLNCPANSNWNGASCVCNSGYSLLNGQCVVNCPTNSNWNGVSCVCNSGYQLQNGQCVPNCPTNSNWNGASCVCNSGYQQVGSQCVPNCPANSSWNGASCVCNSGYQQVGSQCVPNCPANSSWNGANCICNSGYQQQGSNCVPVCPANAYWTGSNCACNTGFYLIGSNCLQCDPNSAYVPAQTTCVCNAGFFGTYALCTRCDTSCATCSGPASNQCLTCPTGATFGNGVCTAGCAAGTYSNGSGCSACMANCAICASAIVCSTCNPGYSPTLDSSSGTIVMICKAPLIGVSSAIALKGNVIGNGIVYQGVTMNLMPTGILTNNCDICSDLFLVNVVSTYTGVTTTVEYVLNSQYWFVITFAFTGAAFIPSFQFTVQINPIHANFFSSVDMAQKLSGTINPTSTTTLFSISGNDATPTNLSTIKSQVIAKAGGNTGGQNNQNLGRGVVTSTIVKHLFK